MDLTKTPRMVPYLTAHFWSGTHLTSFLICLSCSIIFRKIKSHQFLFKSSNKSRNSTLVQFHKFPFFKKKKIFFMNKKIKKMDLYFNTPPTPPPSIWSYFPSLKSQVSTSLFIRRVHWCLFSLPFLFFHFFLFIYGQRKWTLLWSRSHQTYSYCPQFFSWTP